MQSRKSRSGRSWRRHSLRHVRRLLVETLEDRRVFARECSVLLPLVTAGSPDFGFTIDQAACSSPRPLLISGKTLSAQAGFDPSTLAITINDRAVDAHDAAGGFFHQVSVLPGENTFVVSARDQAGNGISQTLIVVGQQLPVPQPEVASFDDVTSSFQGVQRLTSYNRVRHEVNLSLAARNSGAYSTDGELLAAVTHLDAPAVHPSGTDGQLAGGSAFYDLTDFAPTELVPQSSTLPRSIAFYNPRVEKFAYDLTFLARLNKSPAIETAPQVSAVVGRPYAYGVHATDPNDDLLTYSLVVAPEGMSIDEDSGQILWTPTATQRGATSVLVQVDDGRGGLTQQRYVVSVTDPVPNRPPLFISIPVTAAQVNTLYQYPAHARDADDDTLSFSLLSAPPGVNIDPASGLVTWTPVGNQTGTQTIAIEVTDGHGGSATQRYAVLVGQTPGNSAPVILSSPISHFNLPGQTNGPSGNVAPIHIDLDLAAGESSTQTVSLTLPPVAEGRSFADILFVVDESITMAGDHDWLEEMIPQLDAQLQARGIGPNRYILVGFGGLNAREPGHAFNLIEGSLATLYGPTTSTVLLNQPLGPILPLATFEVTATTTGSQLLTLSDTTNRPGAYRFNLLRPGVTTTPLTLGELVSGSLDVPSEKDQYTFTVVQPTQVYFDSLSNLSTHRWSLVGPAGTIANNLPFNGSDARFLQGSPALRLVPGNYTLTVTGASSVKGPYQFRLSDLASATAITPGTPVSATLDPGLETHLYRFQANAGERFYFNLDSESLIGGDSMWRLTDPFGNLVFSRDFVINFAINGDVETIPLAQDGTYTLLIEGGVLEPAPGSYTINVQPAPVISTPLVLGDVVSSTISVAGEKDQYTFSLASDALVNFDSLTNNTQINWTLAGPAGTVVSSRSFFGSDGGTIANPVTSLVSGDYVLTVDAIDDAIGPYSFRLTDLATASALVPGTPVSGTFSVGFETDAYRFTASAGERFYFDVQERSGAGGAVWKLINPFGGVVFNTNFNTVATDVETLTLDIAGTYTLLLEGAINDTSTGSYTINLQPVTFASQSLTLGSTVSNSIGVVGERDLYTFSLPAAAQLYFDALTNNSGLNWTLAGPAGVAANNFPQSDVFPLQPVLRLPSGDYTLTIDGATDTVSSYAFRLFDLAAATPLTLGIAVSGDLEPANETDFYRFTAAAAGDRFAFDLQARTNGGGSRWRLVDPFGNILFNSPFTNITTSDVAAQTLAQPGEYTLLVEGGIADTAAGSYTFVVVPQGNVPPPTPPPSTPMVLGSVVNSTIGAIGEQDRYSFTLASAALLYFDARTNDSRFQWTLTGPAGTAVSARAFTSSDASGTSNPIISVAPGDYVLTISTTSNATGAYAFRLSDPTLATALTPGTAVSGDLSPANETDAYRFTAAAGDRFYFDVTARTNPNNSRWRLFDPYGNLKFDSTFTATSDVDNVLLSQPGAYWLLLEGGIGDSTAGAYTFNVQPAPVTTTPLVLGSPISSAIATPGDQDRYTFTLPAAAQVYFDSQSNSNNLTWTLTGPTGIVVNGRTFNSGESSNLSLLPGSYTLTIDLSGDQTGAYAFRLSDLAAATPLVHGTPISGTLSPANETDYFRFTAAAGDRFYFDVTSRTNGSQARWRLIDPFGNTLFNNVFSETSLSDFDGPTLTQSGAYTLVLEGANTDTVAGDYTIHARPVTIATAPLVLNDLVSAALSVPGEQDRYTFTLADKALLYFDAQTNHTGLTWSLVGPGGMAVNNRNFVSDFALNNPAINAPAGDYVLTIDGNIDQVGAYAFRLWNLAGAAPLTPGTPVSGQLSPGSETDLYQFTAAAGDRFYFDVVARTNGGQSRWQLLDPYGNSLFLTFFSSTTAGSEFESAAFTQPGTYTLLLEGGISDTAGTYTINAQPISITTSPLVLGGTTSGSIASAGEQDRYTFTLATEALLNFDALINSTLVWSLTGPTGSIVTSRVFNVSDGFNAPNSVINLPAGQYSLTIDGLGDVTGPYAFRLSDLAVAPALTPGTPVSGTLDPANESDLYRFNAIAGERYYFDVQTRSGAPGARWRLVDPFGAVLLTNNFSSPSNDFDTLTLQATGAYTVAIEGAIIDTVPGAYTFAVYANPIATQPLTLGTTISSSLSVPGEQDRYVFHLEAPAFVYFDAHSGFSLNWSLAGPPGTLVSARSLNDPEFNFAPTLLPAGDYTLTIDAGLDVTSAYAFRLTALSSATIITPGTPVSGSLNPGNETDLYAFLASPGDLFFFDALERTGGGARWRLIDPVGTALFSANFDSAATNVDTLKLSLAGAYTLLVEGALGASPPGTYSFNVQPVSIASEPLALGSVMNRSIATPGEQDLYTFTLASSAMLYLDALTNNGNLNWTLVGPAGIAVQNRAFNSGEFNGPPLNLVAGDYTLTIDASNEAVGDYSFRMVDLASALPLSPDTLISGSLAPANETDLFSFVVAANSRFSFDIETRTNGGAARWRLIDPYGNIVFNGSFNTTSADVPTTTLVQPGRYTLLVEGGIADTLPGDYAFTVVSQGTATPPTPPVSTPLTLGAVVSSSIAVAAEQDHYTFTLASVSLLYFDSLTNNGNLNWTLTGPAGVAISSRSFTSSDAVNVGTNPVVSLPAGDYLLTVAAGGSNTGSYAFRLSELSSAAPLTPGTPVSGSLDPANETDLYRFTATAGDRFYFDTQARTNGGNSRWRLVDPYGNILFFATFAGGDVDVVTVPQSGAYTLMLEGSVADTTSGIYTVNVQPAPLVTTPLTLGSITSGNLATAGDQDRYTFTLTSNALVYFDSLTSNANFFWSLVGPTGTVVTNRSFTQSDAINVGSNPVLNLPAGDYALTVDANNDLTGPYAFRVTNLAIATSLIPGVPASGTFDVANETDFYRITATAGERYFFDAVTRTGAGQARLRLVDPYGGIVFNNSFGTTSNEPDPIILTQPGVYTLLLEGHIADTGTGTYTINVQPVTFSNQALALSEPMFAALSLTGEQDEYFFSGATGQRLFFDGLQSAANINARLFAPSGTQIFSVSTSTNFGPFFLTETGNYRLSIDAPGDAVGAYGFELHDVASQPTPIGGEVAGFLDLASGSDLFVIDAVAGETLILAPMADLYVGTAQQISVATRSLLALGNFEDGYQALKVGLDLNAFRPGAAINVVMVTDENRDVLDSSLNFNTTFAALDNLDAMINGVHDALFRDGLNRVALGVDSQGNAYLADGAGGYITAPGGVMISGREDTKADYVDLEWALGGAAWDVGQLRVGGLPALSFTKAFVDIKAREIEDQLQLNLVSSNPGIDVQNLTGVRTGVTAGETANFNVKITGDGTPQSFDLLFVRPGSNVVVGSIPVTINVSDYLYPVQAVDADGDPISFSLLEAPEGASINATSGRITWAPPAAGLYRFVVQADDGRGGRDVQEYEVNVTAGAPNDDPAITSIAPAQATEELPFNYAVTATDLNGDLLSYFLAEAPPGMQINSATGRIDWTPTLAQLGNHDVTVRVLDGRGGEDTQSFSLTVVADTANRVPEITSTAVTVASPSEVYHYAAAATDLDGDALSFDLLVAPHGMTVDPQSGVVAWNPTRNQIGAQDAVLRVRDGRGGVDLQLFRVVVGSLGTKPILLPPAPTATAVLNHPYQFRFDAQDADNDTLTFLLEAAPLGMSINSASGVLSWTPAAGQLGAHQITVAVTDTRGLRDSLTFFLTAESTALNAAPGISSTPHNRIGLNSTYYYQVVDSDPNHDRLQYTLLAPPAGMTIDNSGLLSWQPSPTQLGDHAIQLQVNDGRGGIATQNFTLQVVEFDENQAPLITSTPVLAGIVDRLYTYDLRGEDPERGPLFWTLDTAPAGMSLNAARGTLRWTPAADQIGAHEVTVRLYDAQGGFAAQSFTIQVRAANAPPLITSNPTTLGALGSSLVYAVQASDPDHDTLTFLLTTKPAGMTIDSTGVIRWTPNISQLGDHPVSLLVDDGHGGSSTQVFSINVTALALNRPPVFTSAPRIIAAEGLAYTYDASAADPEEDTLTFSLVDAPDGMTIDQNSGLIAWTPNEAQLGFQLVKLTISDLAGNVAFQNFRVLVLAANVAPTIDSTAVTATTAGLSYRYDVLASDSPFDRLSYALTVAPDGMTIDVFGRIAWATGIADIGVHPVTVVVTDSFGATDEQSFQVTVGADTEDPQAFVDLSETPAALGSEIVVFVAATDNVGVTNLQLTAGGVPLVYDTDGRAVFRATQLGTFEFKAIATDAAGNTGEATISLLVFDPSDASAPEVEITSPGDGAVLGRLVDIVGTANHANLQSYVLELAPLGSTAFVEIGRGTTAVINGVLGQLDPTMLQNDVYVLRLLATSAGGNVAATEQIIDVAGDLKLGNFTLSFTDLTVPVFGVPITVSRTYDTLTASQSRDFGYGWRLEFRNMNLRTSVTPTGFEQYGIYNPFKVGSRVYITLPGGNRQAFTFQPQVASGFRGSFLGIFEPRFVPDAGVKSSLTVTPADLRISADGRVFDFATGQPYNPTSSLFGGSFLLTTKDGTAYDIDGNSGQLTSLSDSNDNTLIFSEAGINGPEGSSITFERDHHGRITAVIDPLGKRISYQYDANGDLVAVRDRTDNTTHFVYRSDPAHYLDHVIDPLGRNGLRTDYDAQGRLTKLIDAAGNPVQVIYDPTHSLETIKDRLGNPTTYEYDERGNIISMTDALGGITRRTFDANSNMLTQSNPLGQTTTFTYDDRGNVLTSTDPLGNTTILTYQAFTFGTTAEAAVRGEAAAPFTRIKTATDPLGRTGSATYDSRGNRLTSTDATGATMRYEYDHRGNPTRVQNPDGATFNFTYANGQLATITDPAGITSTLTVDAAGNVLADEHPLQTLDGEVSVRWTYEYDDNGQPTVITHPDGSRVEIARDAAGNHKNLTDELGRRTDVIYSEIGEIESRTDPDGSTVRLEYDVAGRQTAVFQPDGQRLDRTLDALGRVTSVTNALVGTVLVAYDAAGRKTSETDTLGRVTRYTYDALGRPSSVERPGGAVTNYVYDAASRLIAFTDPEGRTTRLTRDDANRVVRTDFADGTAELVTYDLNGRILTRTGQSGGVYTYNYNLSGHLESVRDPAGQLTRYEHDGHGIVNKVIDASGHARELLFDTLGRLTRMTLPGGAVEEYGYDAAGQLVRYKDLAGGITTYEYDLGRRLIRRQDPSGNVEQRDYDAMGRLTEVRDARGTTQLQRDTGGRTSAFIAPDGSSVHYSYDAAGQMIGVATEAGTSHFAYSERGELASVRDTEGDVTEFTSDRTGRPVRTVLPNGHIITRTHDALGRTLAVSYTTPVGVPLYGITYTRDAAGRISRTDESSGRIVTYQYDALDRVIQEAITNPDASQQTITYEYDATGNLTRRNDGTAHTFQYDADDRLLSDGEYTYVWDANGRLASRTDGVTSETYVHDDQGRLVRFERTGAGATVVEYAYDFDGLLASRAVDGMHTSFAWDRSTSIPQLLESRDAAGVLLAQYGRGNTGLTQVRTAAEPVYLVTDHLGTVRAVVESDGSIRETLAFDAFGRPQAGVLPGDIGYTGNYTDPITGLVYLRDRWYSPEAARFIQPDPAQADQGITGTLNRYVYSLNDPVNKADPTGRFALSETEVTIAFFSLLSTLALTVLSPPLTYILMGLVNSVGGDSPITAASVPIASFSVSNLFVMGTAGLEALYFNSDSLVPNTWAVYYYLGVGFTTEGTGVSATVYGGNGLVFDTMRHEDGEGWNLSISLSFGMNTRNSIADDSLKDDNPLISKVLNGTSTGVVVQFSLDTYRLEPDTKTHRSASVGPIGYSFSFGVGPPVGTSASLAFTYYFKWYPDFYTGTEEFKPSNMNK